MHELIIHKPKHTRGGLLAYFQHSPYECFEIQNSTHPVQFYTEAGYELRLYRGESIGGVVQIRGNEAIGWIVPPAEIAYVRNAML